MTAEDGKVVEDLPKEKWLRLLRMYREYLREQRQAAIRKRQKWNEGVAREVSNCETISCPNPCDRGKDTGVQLREAQEVFVYMHRNFRVSRNIRAHWFFDHINQIVSIEDSPQDDAYGREMTVVGIVPKGGRPDEIVGKEDFIVSHDTKIVYISKFYRHVFVLDLSPSAVVSDEDTSSCLHDKLLDCLRLSLEAVTKSFTQPGTENLFRPQIYASVVVFVPFLTFEEDLVLVHGILVTEDNVKEVLEDVTKKFYDLVRSLYTFSRPIMHKWAHVRRIHKNRFESMRESDMDLTECSLMADDSLVTVPDIPNLTNRFNSYMRDQFRPYEQQLSTINIPRRIFEMEQVETDTSEELGCEGYIIPEWALIFMLRLGLIAVQTLPENTQSNIIVITDGVAGMPDPQALQGLLNQMRSFTVSCSIIELKGKSPHEACFGHVTSCELFHFLAMATFGGYIPNCRCSKELNDDVMREDFLSPNPFHRSLLCWSFQNALQENKHIANLVNEVNPVFATLYKNKNITKIEFKRSYESTLNELLYVRLREGFTVKSVEIRDGRIVIHLCLPFRPLVFLEYGIDASWPSCRNKRELINVDLSVVGPENEIRDLRARDSNGVSQYNPLRLKLIDILRSSIHKIEEADALLIHIHSFNTDPAFYSLPRGADDYPIHHLEDSRKGIGMYSRRSTIIPIIRSKSPQDSFSKFLNFWGVLCDMNQENWQKWVHVHFERVVLNCKKLPCDAFTQKGIKVHCSESLKALHEMLRQKSSFCLIKDQLYVIFVKRAAESMPCYFYMIHITSDVPCIIIKLAFLGGISSTERRRVVELFRKNLTDLQIVPGFGDSPVKAVTVFRRPLERILIRYSRMPGTLKTIIRLNTETSHMKATGRAKHSEEIMEHAMYCAIHKYLEGRRRVWRLPLSVLLDAPEDNRSSRRIAEFILSALLHRRIEEGFSVAWTYNGIVGLCRQVDIGSRQLLEQYILFHPANRPTDDDLGHSRSSSPTGLVLVAELWKEPCTKEEDFPQLRPDGESDNELVSVLYTVNHLLLLCSNHCGQLTFVEHQDGQVEQKLSRCVTVVTNAFNLYQLLKNSRRLILHLPTFNIGDADDMARMAALHAAYYAEFATFSNAFVEIDDATFFARIFSQMLFDARDSTRLNEEEFKEKGYDTRYETMCRIFMRKVNPWVTLVSIVPERRVFPDTNEFPVIIAICDEALLTYGLVKRKKVGHVAEFVLQKTEDFRETNFPDENLVDEDEVLNWVSNDRGIRTLRTNYVQITMKSVVKDLQQTVVDRAMASAAYNCLRQGVPVNQEDVGWVLEGVCDYTSIEVEAVHSALETFCAHLKSNPPNDQVCCGVTNLDKVFYNVLGNKFKPVPGNPNYFYFTPPPKEEHKQRAPKGEVPLIHPAVEDLQNQPPRRKNSNLSSRPPTITGDISPDEDSVTDSASISNRGTISISESQPPVRKRSVKSKTKKEEPDAPLFLYFNCVVNFPSGAEEYCPVAFLPSCVHQLLNLCETKISDEDVSKVKVKLLVYVMTWPQAKEAVLTMDYDDDEGSEFSSRSTRFLTRLPEREGSAVKELLATLNRVLELESLLIDSRRDEISHEKLLKISRFIGREVGDSFSDNGRHELCKKNGVAGRMTQRIRELALVIPKKSQQATDDLKKRLENMVVDYCVLHRSGNSNVYYICRVEDKQAFEDQVRNHIHRGHSVTSRSSAVSELRRTESESSIATQNELGTETLPRLLTDLDMGRKDLLYDFWVILTIDDNITLQFCQRYVTEPSHYKIYDLTWKLCRQIIRTINQELLLEHMFEKRVCNILLMPDDDNGDSTCEIIDEEDSLDDTPIVRYNFAPGSLACPVQWMQWLEVHPRLRRKKEHPNGPLFDAAKMLRQGLEQHFVMNRQNTFVIKEENGNVLYVQIYSTLEDFTSNLKSCSIELTKAEVAEAKARMESNTCILVAGFGVRKPSEAFARGLTVDVLQKRMNQHVLYNLIEVWTRNHRTLLDPWDIEFIQPDEKSPAAIMYLSVPNSMSRFMSAVSYFYHQYLQYFMLAARLRETQSGEARPFRPYPIVASENLSYSPIFYLYLRGVQEGSRSKGIACVEMRVVNSQGVMEPLSEGVLRNETHKMLIKRIDDRQALHAEYAEMTTTNVHIVWNPPTVVNGRPALPPPQEPGACGWIQIVFWQAGDVGILELQDTLKEFAERAFCDVITEYGALNVNILERGHDSSGLLPPSSPVTTTPQKSTPKSSPAPSTADARRSLKKRDSTETLQQQQSTEQPNASSVMKRGSSGVSFEGRRGSVASELGREDVVLPVSRERAADRVCKDFYPHFDLWMDFVSSNKESVANSYEHAVFKFDSHIIIKKTLFVLREKLDLLFRSINPLSVSGIRDTVVVCERVSKGNESFYETLQPVKENIYERRIPSLPDDTPRFLLLSFCREVLKESQRYGYEKTTSEPPEVLMRLVNILDTKDSLWNFLPCLHPFVPRQRILFCTVKKNTLTLFMYNFMPDKVKMIKELFTRVVFWYNARARLIQEIDVHPKKALLPEFKDESNNTYMTLVYKHPLALIDHDSPPDKVQFPTQHIAYDLANRLFRPYKNFAPNRQFSCPVTRQLMHFKAMREEVEKHLAQYDKIRKIHSDLLNRKTAIREGDLLMLQGISRRVHFVQTPVLLFPHWRRKIAEVRAAAPVPEPRTPAPAVRSLGFLSSGPPVPGRESASARSRASTVNHQHNNSGVIRQSVSTAKDNDDPCQVIMLYKLLKEYVDYLKTLGLSLFNVVDLDEASQERNIYRTEYPQGSRYPPSVCMFRAVDGGIIIVRLFFVQPYFIIAVGMWTVPDLLLRDQPWIDNVCRTRLADLENAKDTVVSRCHLHSFTYDFHLRMLKKYLVDKEVLFSQGYNINTFLIDFLKYYGCRPPNARNCVYEERATYPLHENTCASEVWEHFLQKHYEEKFHWRVVKIKITDEIPEVATSSVQHSQHSNEYMLVQSKISETEDYCKICVLLRDKRKREAHGSINLAVYLILIDKDQSRPMEEVRHREGSRESDVGEFLNVAQPTEEQLDAETEEMFQNVKAGVIPNVEGYLERRRFSSGGHTPPVAVTPVSPDLASCSSPVAMRSSDSDLTIPTQGAGALRHRSNHIGSDEGEIPGEKVTYVQFLSNGQRTLQQLLEQTTTEYSDLIKNAVTGATRECRREYLWKSVCAILRNPPTSLPKLGPLAKEGSSEQIWQLLRDLILHDVPMSHLNGLIPLVDFENMSEREERLQSLLQGTNCARLCRFLVYKFGHTRCRLFESQSRDSSLQGEYPEHLSQILPMYKALVIINPDNPMMFLVSCKEETTPNIYMLFRKSIGQKNDFYTVTMDRAFDELVQCVTAFLWADLVYKPPGKNLS